MPSTLFDGRLARTSEGQTERGENSSRCRSLTTDSTSGHTKYPITIVTMAMAVSRPPNGSNSRSRSAGGPAEAKGRLGQDALERMQQRLFHARRIPARTARLKWYVLNGHTGRCASATFKAKAPAEVRRAELQAAHDAERSVSLAETINDRSAAAADRGFNTR